MVPTLLCSLFLSSLLEWVVSDESNGQQPNIVFIMVDDMGWNDVSFHGSDQIQTPNIDALAYQGVILQQFYSEAICTPARTALLTGKYPMRLGMHGLPLYNSEDRGIPVTERLLPSYLKDQGYSTHLVGKWHVGMSREEFLPTARGYDTHYGMRGGFVDYYTYNKVETWPNGRVMFGLDLFDEEVPQETEQRYIVDALTDRAVNIIESHNSSQPLFLHLTHNAPHAGNEGGALQPPLYSTVKNKHIANSDRRLYAEIMTYLDRSIGRVVRALNDNNILDNTLIIFMSDNGGPTVGPLKNWSVNLPFRGKKNTPWEGGVRVPAFIWHSSFRPRVWNGLMHITDWLPTLIAASGGQIGEDIDGINQWDSIVRDGLSNRKDVLIAVENGDRNMYAAYRAGDYKLIVGNVTGLSNGYYGADLITDKIQPPNYLNSLRTCEVASIFERIGVYLDFDEITEIRRSTMITQLDKNPDRTPCLPTLNRGCLFNVKQDPTESHDLWRRANKIAVMLTSRLRALWAMQLTRGPTRLQAEADPANFNYVWTPWVDSPDIQQNTLNRNSLRTIRLLLNNTQDSSITRALLVNCDGVSGFRNFLCILRSIL